MQWFLCLLLPLLAHANAHTQLGGHPMPHAQLVPRLPVIYARPVFYHGGVQHPEIWSLGPVLEKLLKFSCPEVFCQILNMIGFFKEIKSFVLFVCICFWSVSLYIKEFFVVFICCVTVFC